MLLEDFIITVFCWVEEHLNALVGERRLRQRGFAPKLTDSEVITLEGVGEFLGLDTGVDCHGPMARDTSIGDDSPNEDERRDEQQPPQAV